MMSFFKNYFLYFFFLFFCLIYIFFVENIHEIIAIIFLYLFLILYFSTKKKRLDTNKHFCSLRYNYMADNLYNYDFFFFYHFYIIKIFFRLRRLIYRIIRF